MKQTFVRGDLVKVSDVFPDDMSHFRGRGELAIVVGSYADQYGEASRETYTLSFPVLEGKHYNGTISWYDPDLLTMVEPRNMERLDFLDGLGKTE